MPKKHSGIIKDKNGTWMIHTRITMPDGICNTFTKRGFSSEGLANEALQAYKQSRFDSYYASKRPLLWTDAAKEFWEYYSSKVKETTAKNAFSSFQKHCVKPFEKFTLVQMLKSNNLHQFRESIEKLNITDGGHKNKIIRHMRRCIDYHYQHGKLSPEEFKAANNELDPIYAGHSIPKMEKPIWTKEEFKRFLDSFSKDDKYYILFEVMGHTGCRVGEIRGLQAKHFDRVASTLYICQQVTSKLGERGWKIFPPKTKGSIRKIVLSERINQLLASYVDEMGYQDDDFLFFGKKPVGDTSIARCLKIHINNAGVKKISTHCIRHSNTTWLLNNPKLSLSDISKVSARLGHESKKVTLDIYYHIQQDNNSEILLDVLL